MRTQISNRIVYFTTVTNDVTTNILGVKKIHCLN